MANKRNGMRPLASAFETFVDAVADGQHRPNRKWVKEMLYGMLARHTVLLSEVGRALDEPRRLIHTEKRLSNHLGSDRLSDEDLRLNYLKLVAPLLRDKRYRRPTIAVDETDIQKTRARAMPHLAMVRDASSRNKDDVGPGYKALCIEAVGEKGRRLPLYARLFSHKDPDFLGEKALVRRAIDEVRPHVPRDALWAFDRGFDGYEWFKTLSKRQIDFVVRLKLELRTYVWANGQKMTFEDLIPQVTWRTRFMVRKPQKKKEIWHVGVGWVEEIRIPIPGYRGQGRHPGGQRFSMVLIENKVGDRPIALLTSVKVRDTETAIEIANAYHDRWGVEEAHRFVKQSFDLENMRALTWTGLQRLVLLCMLAYGYLAYLVHTMRSTIVQVIKSFRAFGGTPTYLYYRLTEGVGEALRGAVS